MTSKRDVQLVRLACKWRWLTAEQGEDCLALERKLGSRHTIEEIIRRRGYLDDDALETLSSAADQATGRRRPLFGRAESPPPRAASRPVPMVRSEQTVVRALNLIAPPPASVRPSRRPRPAEAGPAAPSGLPRDARRAPAPRPEPIPERAPTPAPDPWSEPDPRDATRIEPLPERLRGLGAAVPQVSGIHDSVPEPVRPGRAPVASPPAEVTRFEPLPWFAQNAGSVIEEPPLPESSRVVRRPEGLQDLDEDDEPEPFEATRYDAPDSRLPSLDGMASAERTVLAALPAELLARLRGPELPEGERYTDDLHPVVPSEAMEHTRSQDGTDPGRLNLARPTPRVPSSVAPLARAPSPYRVPDVEFDIDVEAVETLLGLEGEGVANPGLAALLEGVEPLVGAGPTEEPTEDGTEGLSLLLEDGLAEALLGPFGPYQLERIVARGQASVIYAGRDLESAGRVAVKVLAKSPSENQAFISARGGALIAAAGISSPYVVRILDVGRVDARHYVAMEFVEGWSLADKLTFEDPPSASRAFAWASQIAIALRAARRAGVSHGDLRPDRVLIDAADRARLTGFGFAPLVSSGEDRTAPPEGRAETPAADAYGLGLILKAALTEGLPEAELPASLPGAARLLVQALLDPDPAVRPQDFGALSETLSEYAAGLERAPAPMEAAARPGLKAVGLRAGGLAVGLLVLTVGLFVAVGTLGLESSHVAQVVLHSALAGMLGLGVATVLVATLDLIRRGELPLPQSTQWLVQVAEGAAAFGALAGVVAPIIGPPARMNLLLAVLGVGVLFSALFGVMLRRAVAKARPDRGVGRILAVLSDPWLLKWQALHGPALTTVTFLATARFALLAYFAAS